MYENMNENITIGYNEKIISNIKELLKLGWNKLKSFVKSKNKSNFDFYHDLNQKLEAISNLLRDNSSFEKEFNYFLFVKDNISYVVYKNCEDNSFGYCDYALKLLEFFIEIWDARINSSPTSLEYENLHISFKKRYHQYRREFFEDIYVQSGDFSSEEMYNVHKRLRE